MRDAGWEHRPISDPASRIPSQLAHPVTQHLHAVLRHHAVVFYPHPELPELINPGLDREHHAGLETRRVAFDEILGLVEGNTTRSEEHTSELQSRLHLVCRLLLEKKKKTQHQHTSHTTLRKKPD